MNIVDNRRSDQRVTAMFSVEVSGHEGNYALDVGTAGLRLLSRQPLEEDELELRLHLPSDMELTIFGKPVWQQQMSANGKTIAGISFVRGQEEAREALRCWLESYRPN